jgi:hypothetical protein
MPQKLQEIPKKRHVQATPAQPRSWATTLVGSTSAPVGQALRAGAILPEQLDVEKMSWVQEVKH